MEGPATQCARARGVLIHRGGEWVTDPPTTDFHKTPGAKNDPTSTKGGYEYGYGQSLKSLHRVPGEHHHVSHYIAVASSDS